MIVIGIDPGAGSRSPTGLAFINIAKMSIETHQLWPDDRKAPMTIRLINLREQLQDAQLDYYNKQNTSHDLDVLVCCEYFVMRGKGGESLQRLIGAYYSCFAEYNKFIEIQNVKVKQFIGGSGDATKLEVAKGVAEWFKNKNKESFKSVNRMIKQELWDALDALAIAISGYLEYTIRSKDYYRT